MYYLRIAIVLLFNMLAAMPSSADWVAFARDSDGAWGIVVRQPSKKQAEAMAMKQCSKNSKKMKCRVIGSSDRLGYVAVATSKTSVLAELRDSLEEAKRFALDACAENTSKEDYCEIRWTGINGVVREQTQPSRSGNCRPKTKEIRCRWNCVNGDCILEYENGCKVRVNVSPRFDPFSNQWTYPSPSC